MDIIPDLFALIAEDSVFAPFEIALQEITQKSVQFDTRVVGTRQAAAPQAASGHAEITSVFLHHDIRCDFRSTKEGVHALVDRQGFSDPMRILRIRIIPAGLEFFQLDGIWSISIDLVGTHLHKRTLRTGLAGGFQKIQRTHGIGIEIIKGDRRRAVMRWLRSGMHNHIRTNPHDQIRHALPVADIHFVVDKTDQLPLEALLVPTRISLRTKKNSALVIVQSMHGVAKFRREVGAHFGAYQSRRTGHQNGFIFFHVEDAICFHLGSP